MLRFVPSESYLLLLDLPISRSRYTKSPNFHSCICAHRCFGPQNSSSGRHISSQHLPSSHRIDLLEDHPHPRWRTGRFSLPHATELLNSPGGCNRSSKRYGSAYVDGGLPGLSSSDSTLCAVPFDFKEQCRVCCPGELADGDLDSEEPSS